MKKRIFHRRRWWHRWGKVGVVLLSVFLLMAGLFLKCRPVLTAFAESQAVWIATKTANQTVAEILEQYADLCRGMIQVQYADDQHLSSVMPDSASINTVRTAITETAMREMDQLASMSVAIPTGTLLGFDWLSGWGPLVTFPISFTSTVLSDVSSSLEAVGINQSTFRVLIHLDISLLVVTPGGRSSVGAQLSYPMAEAVLLGEVPDNLTEVYGDDQALLGKIFDYGTAE